MLNKFSTIMPIMAFVALSITTSASAAVDNCLVGKWKPDTQQLKQQFEQISKQSVTNIAGEVILTLSNKGAGVYQLTNFTLSMKGGAESPMPMTMNLIMNGNSTFNWSTGNKQFVMNSKKMSIKTSGSVNVGGMKMPIPSIPISDQQASSGVANGSYVCSENKLVFTPKDKGTLLTTWQKM